MKKTSLKNYKTFVKENLNNVQGENEIDLSGEESINFDSNLPKEVLESIEKILQMNFDSVHKPIINDNEITFSVTETDGKLEPEKYLELDLGFGAMKKRKFVVTLNFVSKNFVYNEDEYKYELTYKIIYDLNKMPNKRPSKKKEIEFDDDLTPEEIELKKLKLKNDKKIKNFNLDDVFSDQMDID